MIADPLFYVLAVPAILLAGVSKGGFGTGIGLMAVPLMALAVPVPQAAAIMLPILCVMDLVGLWTYWGRWDNAVMAAMLPAAVLGIAVGALTFSLLDEHLLRLMIGMLAVGFVLNYWFGRRPHGPAQPSRIRGWLWGALSGYTSFMTHAGGPPFNIYVLPLGLDKTALVATAVIFFAAVNYTKLVPYWFLGQLSAGNLGTALALSPLAPVGILAGAWMLRRVNDRLFLRVCYAFLLLSGLKLTWDGTSWLVR